MIAGPLTLTRTRWALVGLLVALTLGAFAAAARADDPATTPTPPPSAAVRPENDGFADAPTLSGSESGSTAGATAESGEPEHLPGHPAHASVWYRYVATATRTVRIDTCGSAFDTVLAVYVGTVVGALTPVGHNDDADDCEGASTVTFAATAGVTYRIAVDGAGDDSGDYILRLDTTTPPNDDESDAAVLVDGPARTGTNAHATLEEDEPDHGGVVGGHSVWFIAYAVAGSSIVVESCASTFDTVLAVYAGGYGGTQEIGSDDDTADCGPGGKGSLVRFTAQSSGTFRVALDGKAGATGHYAVRMMSNDTRPGAISLDHPGTYSNRFAQADDDEPGNSVWFVLNTYPGMQITADTCDTGVGGLDTNLTAYAGDYGGIQEVASNDDTLGCGPGGTGSRVQFTSQGYGSLYFAVDGHGGAVGAFTIKAVVTPVNDDRAGATALSGTPGTIFGTTTGATKEPGEPDHAGQVGGHSVWYRWSPTTGQRGFQICSFETRAIAAVYTEQAGTLSTVAAAAGPPADVGGQSCARVTLTAPGGTSYLIAVDSAESGGFFQLDFGPANDNFADAGELTGSYVFGSVSSATAEPGEPAHAGSSASRSVWYRVAPTVYDGSQMAFDVCSLSTVGRFRLSVYRGSSLNTLEPVADGASGASSCGSESGAHISWRRPAGASGDVYWIAVDAADEEASIFWMTRRYPPFNDDRDNRVQLYVGNSTYGSTFGATHESGEPSHAGAGGGASVWYQFTAYSSEPIQLDLCAPNGGAFDSAIAVYPSTGATTTPIVSADDTPGCGDGRQARVTFTPVQGTSYDIVVDGHAGATGSFQLRSRQRPFNDNRASATQLYGGYPTSGSLDLATKEVGEPDHAGDPGGHSVWYSWTARADGPAVFDTCSTSFATDMLLAVYTADGGDLVPVGANDDAPGCGAAGTSSRVTVQATAHTTYYVAVDGKQGAVGDYELSSPPPNDQLAGASLYSADSFYDYPYLWAATAEPGEPAHAGSPATGSEWYDWRPTRSALATVETCTTADMTYFQGRTAVYTGSTIAELTPVTTLAGSACPAGQTGTRVKFAAVAGASYKIAVDGTTGYAYLRARLAPANDALAAAETLYVNESGSRSASTEDTGVEAGEPDHAQAGGTASVWYRWTAPRSGFERIDTCSSASFDTAIAVYTQSSTGMAGLQPQVANDDTSGCGIDGKGSRVRFHAVGGTTYLIAVAGHGGATGSFTLSLQAAPYNDDLENATYISVGTTTGRSADAGHETGEPVHGAGGGDRSTWWRFWLDGTRNAVVRTCATTGDHPPVTAAYTGPYAATFAGLQSVGSSTATGLCRTIVLRRQSGYVYLAVDGASAGDEPAFTITLRIAPLNDDQEQAEYVNGSGTVTGTTVSATREDGEPQHAGQTGSGSVWYRWTPSYSGPAELSVCDAPFDALLAVYTSDGGALHEIASSDDATGCGTNGSRVSTTVTAGTTYLVAVDTKGGDGSFTLGFPPQNDHLGAASTLYGQSDSRGGTTERATAQVGEPQHAGAAPLRSVWYAWTPSYSGRATFSTCLSATTDNRLAVYTGNTLATLSPVASSGPVPGCADGRGAQVRARVVGGTTYRFAVDAPSGTFTAMVALAPANDDRDDATVVTVPSTQTGSSDYATAEDAEPAHAGHAAAGSVWFSVTATEDGPLALKTCGASFATVLAVYQHGENVPVASSDDGTGSCGTGSHRADVTFSATAGTRYDVALDGRDGTTGAYALAVGSPGNDDVEDAELLSGAHASGEASNVAATTQAQEPQDRYPYARASLWWRWTAPSTGPVRINTCGSELYTSLDVYTGTPGSLTRVTSSDFADGCASRSVLTLNAVQGTTYRMQVSGYYGTVGVVRLQIGPPTNDALSGALALAGEVIDVNGSIVGATREDGEPAFSGTAGRTVWYSWTAPQDGRVRLDTCDSPTAADVAVWDGISLGALTRISADGDQATCPSGSSGHSRTVPVSSGVAYRIAVDGTGSATGAIHLALRFTQQADTIAPVTLITSGPPSETNATTGRLTFVSDDPRATYECARDGGAFTPCTSPLQLTELEEGDHVVAIRGTDEAGNVEEPPAEWSWYVDLTPPDTTIDAGPTGEVHVATGFSYSSLDANVFACAIDGGSFGTCSAGALSELGVGPHTFRVRAQDRAGNVDPTPAERTFTIVNQAPSSASLTVTPNTGPARLNVQATLGGEDPDGDSLTYDLDWGDGTVVHGAVGGSPPTHRYDEAGTYVARVEVRDRDAGAVATDTVVVGAAEPLVAHAGDDLVAVAGTPVRLDGGDSRPRTGIDGYRWTFGDGSAGQSGDAVTHTYEDAGDYVARLQVTSGPESSSDAVNVHVVPGTSGSLVVNVWMSGAPQRDADVIVIDPDGQRFTASTDGDGKARIRGLRDGGFQVMTYVSGRAPATESATVLHGSGAVTIDVPDEPLATASLTSHPMTIDEIRDAGIDPDDPANQHVYEFDVGLNVLPGRSLRGRVTGGGGFIGGAGWHCVANVCSASFGNSTVVVTTSPGASGSPPMLTALVIPFRARFLKEFFDVSMTVHNLAGAGFTLRGGAATLGLPTGLSFAPTAVPQQSTASLGDIPGGQSRAAHWIVRGDVEGEYRLAASWGATLEPFGRSVHGEATMVDPLKVWGGSALKMTVDVDDTVGLGYPYRVRVGLKNVADVPVYNAGVELLRDGRVGYIEQPRQQREFATAKIAPGDTFWAGPYVLVPDAAGHVDLGGSFLRKTAGDVDLEGAIVTHTRDPSLSSTPKLTLHRRQQGVVLKWDAVAGATAYHAFATPNRTTDFPADELPAASISPTKALVSPLAGDNPDAQYAITTTAGGREEMIHPLAAGDSATSVKQPSADFESADVRCGEKTSTMKVRFADEDFPLTQWRYRVLPTGSTADVPWVDGGTLSGQAQTVMKTVLGAGTLEVQARSNAGGIGPGTSAQQAADEWGATESHRVGYCDYVALGDSYSSGEGVPDFEAGTKSDDDGQGANQCHRSTRAYSRLVAASIDEIDQARMKFVACSGALVGDLTGRWGTVHRDPGTNTDVGPQEAALSGDPNLVTLTLGGNDAGFADILSACVISGIVTRVATPLAFFPTCTVLKGIGLELAMSDLRSRLLAAYQRVKSNMAPRGRLLVLGYPDIFPVAWLSGCEGITATDVAWLHAKQSEFNDIIQDDALAAGAEFVSMGNRFTNRSVCAPPGQNRINKVRLPPTKSNDVEYSFHPNAEGQAQMADAVIQQIRAGAPGVTRSVEPQQIVFQVAAVSAAQQVFSVIVGWPGSDVQTTLISPSGRTIGPDTSAPDVHHTKSATQESYQVDHPEPGNWTVNMYGADVDPAGEPVTLRTEQVPIRNMPPQALYSASTVVPTVGADVTFDGTASIDADGSVASYAWEFGDGGTGAGATAHHTFSDAGTYTARLTVTDDKGTTNSFENVPIVVAAAPAGGGGGGSGTGGGGSTGGGDTGGGSTGGGGTGTPGGGTTTGTTPTPKPDPILPASFGRITTAKTAKVKSLVKGGARLAVTGARAGLKLVVKATIVQGKKKTALGQSTLTVKKAGKATLTFKLSKKAAKSVSKAGKGASMQLAITGTSTGGATSTTTLKVALKR